MIELMYVIVYEHQFATSLITNTSSARGNTSLESAVSLTKSLRWEIQDLGQRLAKAANAEEDMRKKSSKAFDKAQHERELKQINQAIRKLLTRIEDAVPLINLAITASGASLSSTLPSTVSPSRLLQASTFLTAGDSQYGASSSNFVQIGPTFTLSMYMLFLGHAPPENAEAVRKSIWKEAIHKAHVRLMRVPINALYAMPGTDQQARSPPFNEDHSAVSDSHAQSGNHFPDQMEAEVRTDEYAYQLLIVEDLEDDRVHDFEDDEPQPGPYLDIPVAGIREVIPIHELSKIFYADTGKILNIGSEGQSNSPVLLLKRDPNANPPRRMMGQYEDDDGQHYAGNDTNGIIHSVETNDHTNGQLFACPQEQHQITRPPDPWRLPGNLDPEWIAFEVYTVAEDSDDESETETASSRAARASRTSSLGPQMTSALSRISVNTPIPSCPSQHPFALPTIRTSLSLLETLLRLLSLQQFEQAPHLSISDEILTFFLNEAASTGAANNDIEERKRVREEARRHVGFDPYDESPVKRRGEDYQYYGREGTPSRRDNRDVSYSSDQAYERYGSPLGYGSSGHEDEGYDTRNWTYPSQQRPPSTPREGTPETPPLLSKNQSKSRTPSSSPIVPGGRYAPPKKWTDSRGGLRKTPADAGKRGSPLARPGTGITDEGLGTSPASVKEEKE